MAYFYVKNSLGTRTSGGGLADQSGSSFTTLGASNVYATIALALADGVVAGDIIVCSDAHNYDAVSTAFSHSFPDGIGVLLTSATDADCGVYGAGAIERHSSGTAADITLDGRVTMHGMTYTAADRIVGSIGLQIISHNCAFNSLDDGAVTMGSGGDTCLHEAHNLTIDLAATSTAIGVVETITGGSKLIWLGGALTHGDTTSVDFMKGEHAIAGGINVLIDGVDLSPCNGTLASGFGGDLTNDDTINIELRNCKTAFTAFTDETFQSNIHRLLVTGCGNSAAAAYQYHFETRGGAIDEETSFYRDASNAISPSSQKISLKCVTNTLATRVAPFQFEFPARYIPFSAAATDKITIYILSSTTLTDADVYAELLYPDGTNVFTRNVVRSVTNAFDALRTGTTLGTNTEAWTGRTTENRYEIELDTSGDAGSDGAPTINMFVAKTSATIYFCHTLGLS